MDSEEVQRCTLCHQRMVEVSFDQVPKDTAERYANLTWYGEVDHTIGWYWCVECNSFSHLLTDEWFKKELSL